jgi:hypothetical protein
MIALIIYSIFTYIYYGGMVYAETEDGEEIIWDYPSILLVVFAPITLPFVLGYLTSKNN